MTIMEGHISYIHLLRLKMVLRMIAYHIFTSTKYPYKAKIESIVAHGHYSNIAICRKKCYILYGIFRGISEFHLSVSRFLEEP
jgi:hypothetical protein